MLKISASTNNKLLFNYKQQQKNNQPYLYRYGHLFLKFVKNYNTMTKHTFKTQGICAKEITFELHSDIVKNIEFSGGCSGNLIAIKTLLEGQKVEDIVKKMGGIKCGNRSTSCVGQLAVAVKEAYDKEQR